MLLTISPLLLPEPIGPKESNIKAFYESMRIEGCFDAKLQAYRCLDGVTYRKSAEFFPIHTVRAILFILGEA